MKPLNKFLYDHIFTILLFLFIFAYMVVNYIYLRANTVPPRWDDAFYLDHSEIVFNALHGYKTYNLQYFSLTTLGQFNLVSLYLHLLGGRHAPLIALLPLPSYFIFGTGFPGWTATFLGSILVFNFVFYRFVSEMADQPTALLAAIITSTMPLTIGLARYFVVEYGLMILVTLWVFLQLKSNHFRDGHHNIWMGIVLGLGMLMKVSFPVYIIGPIIWGLVSVIIEIKFDKKKLVNVFRNCIIVLLVGALLMGTWYLPNIKEVLGFAYNAGFGQAAQDYSTGNPFDIQVLLNYWIVAINIGISAYYFFVLGLLSVAQGIAYVSHKKRSSAQLTIGSKTSMWIMLPWFLVPFLVFSFGVNKDTRYLLPILPPVGFVIASLMVRLFYRNKLGKAAIVLLLTFPLLIFGYISLPLSSSYSLGVGPFLMVAPQIGWATRPTNQVWPLEKMLLAINDDAKKTKGINAHSPVFVGVVPSFAYLNANNLGYYSTHYRLPFHIEPFESPLNGDWTVQKDRILSKDYLITKTGDQGPSFAYNPYLTPLLLNGELPFDELARFRLPDGSDGIIYKRGISPKNDPTILSFVRNISIGDQFGSLSLESPTRLFIHPGLTTPTQFEFDTAAFIKQKGQQTIKIVGAMHPNVPEEAVKRGAANVRLIAQINNKTVIDAVISVKMPFTTELAISGESPVLFIVENNGNPDTDWFLLSIE